MWSDLKVGSRPQPERESEGERVHGDMNGVQEFQPRPCHRRGQGRGRRHRGKERACASYPGEAPGGRRRLVGGHGGGPKDPQSWRKCHGNSNGLQIRGEAPPNQQSLGIGDGGGSPRAVTSVGIGHVEDRQGSKRGSRGGEGDRHSGAEGASGGSVPAVGSIVSGDVTASARRASAVVPGGRGRSLIRDKRRGHAGWERGGEPNSTSSCLATGSSGEMTGETVGPVDEGPGPAEGTGPGRLEETGEEGREVAPEGCRGVGDRRGERGRRRFLEWRRDGEADGETSEEGLLRGSETARTSGEVGMELGGEQERACGAAGTAGEVSVGRPVVAAATRTAEGPESEETTGRGGEGERRRMEA